MLLEGKNAIIYGGGGAIGSAVAQKFAAEGARVVLVGRSESRLQAVAERISAAGGRADVAVLDALDDAAVDRNADALAARAGSIDISFNLISIGDVQGTPLADMRTDDFMQPIVNAVRSTFITARAAARHMRRQRSGVILMFGGQGEPLRNYYIGGLQVAFAANEMLRRQLSAELGPHGIRVVTLRTGGIPETLDPEFQGREELAEQIASASMLKRAATLEDVANVAAFVASDQARTMTAASVNISAGALVD